MMVPLFDEFDQSMFDQVMIDLLITLLASAIVGLFIFGALAIARKRRKASERHVVSVGFTARVGDDGSLRDIRYGSIQPVDTSVRKGGA